VLLSPSKVYWGGMGSCAELGTLVYPLILYAWNLEFFENRSVHFFVVSIFYKRKTKLKQKKAT